MTFKSLAQRTLLLAGGVCVGVLLFLLAGLALAFVGLPPGYALYNGYVLALLVWLGAAVLVYLRTRPSPATARWNVAAFMLGVLALPLLGTVAMLVQEREFLVFFRGIS